MRNKIVYSEDIIVAKVKYRALNRLLLIECKIYLLCRDNLQLYTQYSL